MTDPMPRKEVELPPRMPEAAIIAELRAENARLRADAQAAVALAVERAAEEVDRHYAAGDTGNPGHWVRAHAPVDGLAMAEALRKERDELRERARMLSFMGEGYVFLEQERDCLAADLAAAQAQIEALRGALKQIEEQDDAGDMMYHALGPFAKIARAALAALPAKEGE